MSIHALNLLGAANPPARPSPHSANHHPQRSARTATHSDFFSSISFPPHVFCFHCLPNSCALGAKPHPLVSILYTTLEHSFFDPKPFTFINFQTLRPKTGGIPTALPTHLKSSAYKLFAHSGSAMVAPPRGIRSDDLFLVQAHSTGHHSSWATKSRCSEEVTLSWSIHSRAVHLTVHPLHSTIRSMRSWRNWQTH
jgi:hypothetical protein